MNEDQLTDFLFDSLAGGAIDFSTGIPITPIRMFLRLFEWLNEGNPSHRRAASRAVRRYVDYNNPTGFFDYNRF